MGILIKGGILATKELEQVVDIVIEEGVIAQVTQLKPWDRERLEKSHEVIDASGAFIFPGFIDAHTHLDMDTGTAHTADDFKTGTKAALAGGTTTIVDFATQNKGETLALALKNWHEKASGKSSTDYGFHMAITDWNDSVAEEITAMKEEGITSFKLYMAYDALRLGDGKIYEILKKVAEIEGIVGVHCENGDLVNELIKEQLKQGNKTPAAHPLSRPSVVEAEAIGRFLDIAYIADTPAHIVHLSTLEGLEQIKKARKRGQEVFVETCPQYLLLDESYYTLPDFESAKYVLSPPLRTKVDREKLWKALKESDIDTISTDHCSFNFKNQKEQGIEDFSKIPSGIPGIEHRPELIYTYGVRTGKLTLYEMAHLLSTNSAKLFGMYPRKGAVQVGSDADLVIWDPEFEGTLSASTQLQNVDYTPFEGFKIKGRPKYVFLRGTKVVEEGQVIRENLGEYVSRKKSLSPRKEL